MYNICVCASIRPGLTVQRCRSITSALSGFAISFPALIILLPFTNICWLVINVFCSASYSLPTFSRYVLADCAVAKKHIDKKRVPRNILIHIICNEDKEEFKGGKNGFSACYITWKRSVLH
jgi:hypothetical protein